MDEQLQKLLEAAREAVVAMKYDDEIWRAEGYQGGYTEDECKALDEALKPFEK